MHIIQRNAKFSANSSLNMTLCKNTVLCLPNCGTMYVFLQQAANKFKMKFSVMYKNNTGLCLELEACCMLE